MLEDFLINVRHQLISVRLLCKQTSGHDPLLVFTQRVSFQTSFKIPLGENSPLRRKHEAGVTATGQVFGILTFKEHFKTPPFKNEKKKKIHSFQSVNQLSADSI